MCTRSTSLDSIQATDTARSGFGAPPPGPCYCSTVYIQMEEHEDVSPCERPGTVPAIRSRCSGARNLPHFRLTCLDSRTALPPLTTPSAGLGAPERGQSLSYTSQTCRQRLTNSQGAPHINDFSGFLAELKEEHGNTSVTSGEICSSTLASPRRERPQ
jgi:hypothetical protein